MGLLAGGVLSILKRDKMKKIWCKIFHQRYWRYRGFETFFDYSGEIYFFCNKCNENREIRVSEKRIGEMR